ncbi:MAG: extracellular solute-binding protein [Anaerolineae bacterium]
MKIKLISIVLVSAFLAALAGCVAPPASAPPSPQGETTESAAVVSTESATGQEPVRITFWEWFGGAWGDFFEEEAQRFHAAHPDVVVEVSHFPDQSAYREVLALAFESGSAPDTFLRRHTFSQVFENGWAQSIDPWLTPEWLAKFPEASFVETKNVWDGRTYAFPVTALKLDRVIYVNEDMFRAAGLTDAEGNITVPETWDDLRSMAKKITETGNGAYYGIGIGIKDPRQMSWWFDLADLAGASGTYEFDYRTGAYNFGTDPAFSRVIELLLGMKADGSVYPYESTLDDSNLYTGFGQGQYAMFLSGSWTASNLERDFPELKNYRIIPLPIPDEGRQGGLPYTPGSGQYYMSATTQYPDEAWLWLDWISSRGFHERMVSKALDYSVYPDLNTADLMTDPIQRQAYDALFQYLVSLPSPTVRNPETTAVIPGPVIPDTGDVLVGIYTGQIKDWENALLDLDARKQAAFDAAIEKAQSEGADVSIEDFVFPDWNPMENYITVPEGP